MFSTIITLIQSRNTIKADKGKEYTLQLVLLMNLVEEDLFDCLTKLSEYFAEKTYELEEETSRCFKGCAGIVRRAIDRVKSGESSRADEDMEPVGKKARTNTNRTFREA